MMDTRTVRQGSLFYGFTLEDHIPEDHVLRLIDCFVELSGIRRRLEPYYSAIGRPSVDPELMIRMLLIGYRCGIRLARRLCQEVSLNLAYRWFRRLDLTCRAKFRSSADPAVRWTAAAGGREQEMVNNSFILIISAWTRIGSGAAVAFTKNAARVAASGRDGEGNAPEDELRRLRAEASFVPADLCAEDDVRNLPAAAGGRFGRIGRIDDAGQEARSNDKPGQVVGRTAESCPATFDTNILGTPLWMNHGVREMQAIRHLARPDDIGGVVASLAS